MPGKLRVDRIFAFIAEDEHGEGIMGFRAGGQWFPMIGADMDRVKSLLPVAREIARSSGKSFKIIQLVGRTDITNEINKKYPIGSV